MIWLWLCLTIPSLAEVHKYLGLPGVAAYLGIVAGALWLLPRLRLADRITESQARWLAVATLFAVAALFVGIYPIAQANVLGPGSDSDDSLNVAVGEMLHGRYPYYARTYLGNAVHEMPGMLLLSAPFVLMGNSAYMNLFWLAALLFAVREEYQDGRQALLFLWSILALCPHVMQQVVTGGNQLANSAFAMVLLWWMVRRNRLIAAVLFGLALSSRANFLLLVPPAYGYIARQFGWRRGLRDLGVALATFLVVTLPFYVHDPAHFMPLQAADRLTRFDEIFPYLGVTLGAAGASLSFLLAWRDYPLFASCAMVQAFFVITAVLLGRSLGYSNYGVFFVFFALLDRWKVVMMRGPKTDGQTPT